VPDPCDICVMQPDGDSNAPLDDGCPGFRMTDACGLTPGEDARVTRLAGEIAHRAHFTSIRILSARAGCARAVRDALMRAGTPPGRLETAIKGTDASVFLEVGAWDGRRCGP
jgi:hypothetical protein